MRRHRWLVPLVLLIGILTAYAGAALYLETADNPGKLPPVNTPVPSPRPTVVQTVLQPGATVETPAPAPHRQ